MSAEQERAQLSTEVPPERRGPDGSVQPDAAPTDERLAIGQTLSGRYRIERELGEGGMGVVYLATDAQIAGETFAIKVLKEGVQPWALEMLREEVRNTRKLSHPNIVDMHSVNVDGTKLYVLMEYLEGKSLNALLDEEFGRGMPLSRAGPIIEDVGAALGYAHDHSVIHSDLKPANVFVTTSGKTKLLDFGIARVSRGALPHKPLGPLALTPDYASCEMLEGKDADARDDIYSFACVIYEMLSGKRPFAEFNALEAREAGCQVPSLQMLTRGQNEALAKALAFDREGRTSSVEKLLERLAADKGPRAPPIAIIGGAIIGALAALGLTYLILDKLWTSRHSVVVQSVAPGDQQAASRAAGTAAFNPPPRSIAVLPFVNMSGDKEQDYFSDGLSEELLNDLARINELQVAARTSAFSFKGKDIDIATIAHRLNVASVLEGSVRRSGHTIRVTAQLNNAVTGFHLWSQTYDRDLGDVLKLQTEIASAVVNALKVTLLNDLAVKVELGGTRNPAAFDAYLRGEKAASSGRETKAIAEYTDAVRLDSNYALAFAGRSYSYSHYASAVATGTAIREYFDKGLADARRAIELVPELGEGHLAMGFYLQWGALDFRQASQSYERARALAPGSARILRTYGLFAVNMGQFDAGLTDLRRAVALDPLNPQDRTHLGMGLYFARRYEEAIVAFEEATSLDPDWWHADGFRGLAYYVLGNLPSARSSCESKADHWTIQWCLAVVYDKLGRHADAEVELKKSQAARGDDDAYNYAAIYAQWGDRPKALEWLDRALQLRDTGLVFLKTDPLLDPLRNEPRFQAIERQLKFPQ